jgi:tetratricopeptide (TPR) repeat protein
MQERATLYFEEAIALAKGGFNLDAIEKFKKLVQEFPESDLADDAEYNVALCYFQINQFEKAISILESLVADYPEATITPMEKNGEFGRTAAKSYYLMVICYLALGRVEKAEEIILKMGEYIDSYVMKGDKKFTYSQLGREAIETYISINKKLGDKK